MMKTTKKSRVFGLLLIFLVNAGAESGEINGKMSESNSVEKEAIGKSSIRVISNPPGASIYLDGQKIGITPFTLSTPDSCQQKIISVSKRFFITRTDTIGLLPDSISEITYELQPGGVIVVPNKSYYKIKINDKPIETFPSTPLRDYTSVDGFPFGDYHVVVERQKYYNWEKDLSISESSRIVSFKLKMRKRSEVIYEESIKCSLIFPGIGQLHSREYLKGILFIGLMENGLRQCFYLNTQYNSENKIYSEYLTAYQNAIGLTTIDKYRERARKSRDKLIIYRQQFFWTAGAIAATYLINIADIKWLNSIIRQQTP